MNIITEMRRVAASHLRNGERLTADLLDRAVEHIFDLQANEKKLRARLERISAGKPERDDPSPNLSHGSLPMEGRNG